MAWQPDEKTFISTTGKLITYSTQSLMQPIHYSHNSQHRNLEFDKEDIAFIEERIAKIKSYTGCTITNENFNSIYKSFYELVDRIPTPTLAVDVNYLIRSRPNEGTKLFSKETEISYNSTNTTAIKKGRFNRPEEPMFYGCAPGESSVENHFLLTACIESYKDIIQDKNREPFKYFTVGKWYVNRPFYVVNLCLNDALLLVNPKMRERTDNFIQMIKTQFPTASKLITENWQFITDLASKKEEIESDHFLTTAFWCAVWKYCETVQKANANGILYPSPATKNEGINLVLQPQAVDQLLTLRSVFMVKFERDESDPKQFRIFQCSEEVPVINGRFDVQIDHSIKF